MHTRPESTAKSPWTPPTVGIPSWIVSVAAHGVLLFVFASLMRSCSGDGILGDGDTRQVGLVARDSSDALESEPAPTTDANPAAAAEPAAEAPVDTTAVDNLLNLPSSTIGIGSAGPSVPLNDIPQELRPSTLRPTGPPQTNSGAKATFFGVSATGKSVVYVLDKSPSMSNHNAIGVAKAELKASLEGLSSDQSFQIVFFDTSPQPMQRPGGKSQLFPATTINRTLAGQFIRNVEPSGGTRRMPALQMAMSLQPDIIFLLTDVGDPHPGPGDLDRLRKSNRGRTTIHCVEFGSGPALSAGLDNNFLKEIARQNGGTYRYRDITQFDRKR